MSLCCRRERDFWRQEIARGLEEYWAEEEDRERLERLRSETRREIRRRVLRLNRCGRLAGWGGFLTKLIPAVRQAALIFGGQLPVNLLR